MKKILLLVSLFILATIQGQTTQDSLFVWKTGVLVHKLSIKPADMDSITFKRPTPTVTLKQVTICSQVWATKNLEVTTYSDGTPIPQVTDPTQWKNLTTGAWCYYNNDPANGAVYGKLYNWYAVAGIYDAASASNSTLRKKLAPIGCHVPTDEEWVRLTDCLGGGFVAGGKMKSTGTSLWFSPNINATNSSGFTGLPGGSRNTNGTFYPIRFNGNWWSSSESSTSDAWARNLNYDYGYAFSGYDDKNFGYSVRCLRD